MQREEETRQRYKTAYRFFNPGVIINENRQPKQDRTGRLGTGGNLDKEQKTVSTQGEQDRM